MIIFVNILQWHSVNKCPPTNDSVWNFKKVSSHKHTHTHTQIYWAFKCLGISWQTLVCFLLRKWECNFLISHWDSEYIILLRLFIFKYTLKYFEFSDFLCHAHSMQWYDWIVNENVFVVFFSTTKSKKKLENFCKEEIQMRLNFAVIIFGK